jgi:hypothetical protein
MPIYPNVLSAIVAGSVAQIRVLNTEIARIEASIAEAISRRPKAKLLETLPRTATVSLAQLIAEIGPLLDRRESPRTGRGHLRCGICDPSLWQDPYGRVPLRREQGISRGEYWFR